MGVGEALVTGKQLNAAVADMELIAGQKPVVTLARNSIAGFKVREGWPIGCKVTLRRSRMYEFLDRLISIAIPRQRDFRGVSPKSFDGRGNFSMGVTEQIVFAEIDYDKTDRIRGLDINITTTAKTDERGKGLTERFQFPFPRSLSRCDCKDKAGTEKELEDEMAKVSMVNRELKRAGKTVKKYAAKRAALKAQIRDLSLSDEERWEAQMKLQKVASQCKPMSASASLSANGSTSLFIAGSDWRERSSAKRQCVATSQAS